MVTERKAVIRVLIASAPSENYAAAVRLAGMEPLDSSEADPEQIEACAALILPGGGDVDPELYGQENTACRGVDRAADLENLALIRQFMNAGKPILGICKGHQLLNVACGGTLIQDIPEEPRHGFDRKSKKMGGSGDRMHMVAAAPGSWLAELYGRSFPVNSCHHQAVGRLAEGFQVIAYSDDGVIEAMIHREKPVFSLQWHPERMCGEHRREDTVDGLPVFLQLRKLAEKWQTQNMV